MRCHIVFTHCHKGAIYPAYGKSHLHPRTLCMGMKKGSVTRLIALPVARTGTFFSGLQLSRGRTSVTGHLLARVAGHLRFLLSIKLNCLALSHLSSSLSKKRDRHVGLTASLKDDLIKSLCVLSRPDVKLRSHSASLLVGILQRLRTLNGAIIIIRRSRRVVHTTSCVVSVNPGTNHLNKRIICRNSISSLGADDGDCAIQCLAKRSRVRIPLCHHP